MGKCWVTAYTASFHQSNWNANNNLSVEHTVPVQILKKILEPWQNLLMGSRFSLLFCVGTLNWNFQVWKENLQHKCRTKHRSHMRREKNLFLIYKLYKEMIEGYKYSINRFLNTIKVKLLQETMRVIRKPIQGNKI